MTDRMKSRESKILIVGAGPTGLTAALTFAKKGIIPRIIDKRTARVTTSNALAIQPRTLELWEEIGLIDDALSLGHKIHGLNISTNNKGLGKISLNKLPTKYPFILALPQAKTEELLIEHLSKYGIEIERDVCLNNLIQHDNYVEAVCNDETNSYSWVIGCDGTHSTVRELAKIPFEGKNLLQHFIMADLTIDWQRPSDFVYAILSSSGPIAFIPLNNKGFGRLIIEVTGNEHFKEDSQPSLEYFQKLMNERSGLKVTLSSPSWISSFYIQSRIAESYRKGRLLLAGDAAHCHSPFGGQGLNTGVQDAYFLANLLTNVMQTGNIDEINRYETIRWPIGKQIVHRTAFMTEIITSRSKIIQVFRNFMISIMLSIKPIQHKIVMTISQLIYR